MSAGYSPYRWKTQDGVARRRYNPVYRCYSVASGKIGCKGKTSYKKELIEDTVVEDVLNHLETLKTVDLTKEISRLKKENVSVEEKTLKTLQKEIEKTTKERTLLEGEVVKAIAGESSFDKDMLARMINEKTTRLSELERSVLDTGEILQLKRIEYSDMVRLQKMIPVWRKEYEDADFEAKKVLLSKIIERVTIFRDKIQVKLRLQITDYGKANAVHKPSGSASGDSCYLDDNADLSIIGINRRPDRYR